MEEAADGSLVRVGVERAHIWQVLQLQQERLESMYFSIIAEMKTVGRRKCFWIRCYTG